MARFRIIILEQVDVRSFRYALWADVPASRQSFYANAALVSAWKDAIASDNTALQNGSVVESVDTLIVEQGTTLAGARQQLQDAWQSFQDAITARNPWVRYGSTWNGTTWTVSGAT